MNIRIHNTTDRMVYSQKKIIQTGQATRVLPDNNGVISMYCADKYIRSIIGLYYDLNITDIVVVDNLEGMKPLPGRYGVAYVDFIHQYFKAGDPIRQVAYPVMYQVGSLTKK